MNALPASLSARPFPSTAASGQYNASIDLACTQCLFCLHTSLAPAAGSVSHLCQYWPRLWMSITAVPPADRSSRLFCPGSHWTGLINEGCLSPRAGNYGWQLSFVWDVHQKGSSGTPFCQHMACWYSAENTVSLDFLFLFSFSVFV